MNLIPLIVASQVKPFSDSLNQTGAPVERLMQQARLSVVSAEDPNALPPITP